MLRLVGVLVVYGVAIWLVSRVAGTFAARILIAGTIAFFTFKVGSRLLGGFAQPMAEPPPPGEMRKVKLNYRCDICGSEARMTMAPDEEPPAPRHCLEDMHLITPVE